MIRSTLKVRHTFYFVFNYYPRQEVKFMDGDIYYTDSNLNRRTNDDYIYISKQLSGPKLKIKMKTIKDYFDIINQEEI